MEEGRPYSRLIKRLDGVAGLSDDDKRLIAKLPMQVKNLNNQDVAREGEISSQCVLVLDGYLYRHKLANGSRRQIISFYVPGDLPDLHTLHLPKLDHTLSSLGPAVIAQIPHSALRDMMAISGSLTHAFWRETLVDAAIYREWVINLGQRDAIARVAHVLCELIRRLQAVGLARENGFVIPWTQSDLADACGISTVHANRVVQELRRLRLIAWNAKLVQIVDWEGMARIGDFNDGYLYLRKDEDITLETETSLA